MKPYRNPEAGIKAYDIGTNYILIQFEKTGLYLYPESRVGAKNLAQMKMSAEIKDDLDVYLSKNRRIQSCGISL